MDASKNFSLGFGGIYLGKHWMQSRWPIELEMLDPSIQYLELYAQVAGILAWGKIYFSNSTILIHCDNQSVVSMINNNTSSCKNCVVLIRILVYYCLIHNIRVTTEHIVTDQNEIADSLSCFLQNRFLKLTKHCHLDSVPTRVLKDIWPPMKIWLD